MPIFAAATIPVWTAIAAATGAAATGVGIYSAVSSGGGETPAQQAATPKATPEIPAIAPAPIPEDAEAKAKAELEKQRKMRALAGGKTILAEGAPVLSNNAGKTLLGS
jgi:hypothetical protein